MSVKYAVKYPKSHWENSIIEYIGLTPGKTYYKCYVCKCLLNKLKDDGNFNYGRYELDDNLMELIKNKLNTNYIWKYSSKSGLSNILRYFRHNDKSKVENKSIYEISFNENGNNIITIAV